MLRRVRERGNETPTASDLRPRLAMAMFLSCLLLLYMRVVMLGSSLVDVARCLRFSEAMSVCASMRLVASSRNFRLVIYRRGLGCLVFLYRCLGGVKRSDTWSRRWEEEDRNVPRGCGRAPAKQKDLVFGLGIFLIS